MRPVRGWSGISTDAAWSARNAPPAAGSSGGPASSIRASRYGRSAHGRTARSLRQGGGETARSNLSTSASTIFGRLLRFARRKAYLPGRSSIRQGRRRIGDHGPPRDSGPGTKLPRSSAARPSGSVSLALEARRSPRPGSRASHRQRPHHLTPPAQSAVPRRAAYAPPEAVAGHKEGRGQAPGLSLAPVPVRPYLCQGMEKGIEMTVPLLGSS